MAPSGIAAALILAAGHHPYVNSPCPRVPSPGRDCRRSDGLPKSPVAPRRRQPKPGGALDRQPGHVWPSRVPEGNARGLPTRTKGDGTGATFAHAVFLSSRPWPIRPAAGSVEKSTPSPNNQKSLTHKSKKSSPSAPKPPQPTTNPQHHPPPTTNPKPTHSQPRHPTTSPVTSRRCRRREQRPSPSRPSSRAANPQVRRAGRYAFHFAFSLSRCLTP